MDEAHECVILGLTANNDEFGYSFGYRFPSAPGAGHHDPAANADRIRLWPEKPGCSPVGDVAGWYHE